MIARLCILACCVLLVGCRSIEPTPTSPRELLSGEVIYRTIDDSALTAHVFQPDRARWPGPRPAIVFYFGGGWVGGSPSQFFPQCEDLAESQGMVAISVQYRTRNSHGVSPVECVDDAFAAFEFVRTHAEDLGIDPARIVASGGSAGGHLAACVGLLRNGEAMPAALVLYNPVLDTSDAGFGAARIRPAAEPESLSPMHHVRPGLPPTLVLHGTADRTVPFAQAERFVAAMRDAGNTCELAAFEGEGHGFFNHGRPSARADEGVPPPYDAVQAAIVDFLHRTEVLD